MRIDRLDFGARKVGTKGPGLDITLPALWVRNAGISVGDRVGVTAKGTILIIRKMKQ